MKQWKRLFCDIISFQTYASIVLQIIKWLRFCIHKNRRNEDVLAYRILQDSKFDKMIAVKCCNESATLPSNLLISKKKYMILNKIYECENIGVYRFLILNKYNLQRVVIDENNPVSSALLLACVAYRGNRDDALSLKQAEKKARRSLLAMTCGPLSRLIHFLLEQQRILSRVVNTHTLEELNDYNNGHTLLEVWLPAHERYVVVDVDKKAVFEDENSKMMDLFELTFAVYNKLHFSIRRLQTPSNVDWSGFTDEITSFNYQFYEAWVYGSEKGIEEMIRRTCQIPIFSDNDTVCACAWSHEVGDRLRKLEKGWTLLSPDLFLERFYGHD